MENKKRKDMQIQEYYTDMIQSLDYINDDQTAKETVKAVTGIIASSVDEQTARDFTAALPKELDYDTLRGHQEYTNMDTPEDCIGVLKDQFGWHDEQALTAMWKVTNIIAQNAPGEISELLMRLPSEWQAIFDQAPE